MLQHHGREWQAPPDPVPGRPVHPAVLPSRVPITVPPVPSIPAREENSEERFKKSKHKKSAAVSSNDELTAASYQDELFWK